MNRLLVLNDRHYDTGQISKLIIVSLNAVDICVLVSFKPVKIISFTCYRGFVLIDLEMPHRFVQVDLRLFLVETAVFLDSY